MRYHASCVYDQSLAAHFAVEVAHVEAFAYLLCAARR